MKFRVEYLAPHAYWHSPSTQGAWHRVPCLHHLLNEPILTFPPTLFGDASVFRWVKSANTALYLLWGKRLEIGMLPLPDAHRLDTDHGFEGPEEAACAPGPVTAHMPPSVPQVACRWYVPWSLMEQPKRGSVLPVAGNNSLALVVLAPWLAAHPPSFCSALYSWSWLVWWTSSASRGGGGAY